MADTPLDTAFTNAVYGIRNQLEDLAAYQEDGSEAEAIALFGLGVDYRMLALALLLRDFDARGFSRYMAHAGMAGLTLLERQRAGAGFPDKYLCVSKDRGFFASLAAGDLETAGQIADASPPAHFARFEYEDDFLHGHFLRRCLVAGDDAAALETILARLEAVLEGAESVRLEVDQALLARDSEAFEASFDFFLGGFEEAWAAERTSITFSPPEGATEGQICVEGLAILQIAALRGIETRPEYRFVPKLARIAPGSTELRYDWRSPNL